MHTEINAIKSNDVLGKASSQTTQSFSQSNCIPIRYPSTIIRWQATPFLVIGSTTQVTTAAQTIKFKCCQQSKKNHNRKEENEEVTKPNPGSAPTAQLLQGADRSQDHTPPCRTPSQVASPSEHQIGVLQTPATCKPVLRKD